MALTPLFMFKADRTVYLYCITVDLITDNESIKV